MAKSTIKLNNGTVITVEGTTEEIKNILSIYKDKISPSFGLKGKKVETKNDKKLSTKDKSEDLDIMLLVNSVKETEDYIQIEKNILEKSSQLDRTLLPLFLADREFQSNIQLGTSDIFSFLKEFGVKMSLANISKLLGKKGTAKYIISDSARKKGTASKYKISINGRKYIKQVLLKQHE